MGVMKSNRIGRTGRRLPAIFMAVVLMLSGLYLGTGEVLADAPFEKNVDNTGVGTKIMCNPEPVYSDNSYWKGSYVYFGHYDKDYKGTAIKGGSAPVRYRVLQISTQDYNTAEQTAAGRRTMFLDCDWPLFKKAFDSNSNEWSTSEIKTYLNGNSFLNNSKYFVNAEKDAVAESTKTEVINLDKDKLFMLDQNEACNRNYGYLPDSSVNSYSRGKQSKLGGIISDPLDWWLRDNYNNQLKSVREINNDGGLSYMDHDSVIVYVCPAMNLDISKVLFSSCISGTKGQEDAEYKLTIVDKDIKAGLGTPISIKGDTITVPYSVTGANAANANRLSILITDKAWTSTTGWSEDTKILQYSKLNTGSANPSSSGKGTFVNGVKGTWGKDYHVYLLAEDIADDAKSSDIASAPVELTKAPVIIADEVTVSPETADLMVGETIQLKAEVTPANAVDRSVSWSSSNESVATVSNNGLVTATGAGAAVITAKANDGSGKTDTCNVTVNAIPQPEPKPTPVYTGITATKIKFQKSSIKKNYDDAPFKVELKTIKPENADVFYESNNTGVATVDEFGEVTIVGPGKAKIKAYGRNDKIKATCNLTVKGPQMPKSIKITKVKEIERDQTITLSATIKPTSGIPPEYTGITWSFAKGHKGTAVLDPDTGVLTCTGAGDIKVQATTVNGKKATMTIKGPKQVSSVKVKTADKSVKTGKLTVGDKFSLVATVSPNKAIDKTVTWHSDNEAVATVDREGNVICVGPGSASIYATSVSNTAKSGKVKLTVK